REDAAQFFLICRLAKKMDVRRWSPMFAEVLLQFVAENPFFLASSEMAYNFITSTGEGLKIPFTIPATIFGGGNIATVVVNNSGQVEVFPKISILGLAENPQVNNITTGRSFKVNRTLEPKDGLQIDMAKRTAKIVNPTEARINVLGDISGQFWSLERGQNTIRIVTDGSAVISGMIRFTARYLAVV
ncbi:hypothetical protein LCGC14_2976480, partial [marine sediment metagenome]